MTNSENALLTPAQFVECYETAKAHKVPFMKINALCEQKQNAKMSSNKVRYFVITIYNNNAWSTFTIREKHPFITGSAASAVVSQNPDDVDKVPSDIKLQERIIVPHGQSIKTCVASYVKNLLKDASTERVAQAIEKYTFQSQQCKDKWRMYELIVSEFNKFMKDEELTEAIKIPIVKDEDVKTFLQLYRKRPVGDTTYKTDKLYDPVRKEFKLENPIARLSIKINGTTKETWQDVRELSAPEKINGKTQATRGPQEGKVLVDANGNKLQYKEITEWITNNSLVVADITFKLCVYQKGVTLQANLSNITIKRGDKVSRSVVVSESSMDAMNRLSMYEDKADEEEESKSGEVDNDSTSPQDDTPPRGLSNQVEQVDDENEEVGEEVGEEADAQEETEEEIEEQRMRAELALAEKQAAKKPAAKKPAAKRT